MRALLGVGSDMRSLSLVSYRYIIKELSERAKTCGGHERRTKDHRPASCIGHPGRNLPDSSIVLLNFDAVTDSPLPRSDDTQGLVIQWVPRIVDGHQPQFMRSM